MVRETEKEKILRMLDLGVIEPFIDDNESLFTVIIPLKY
jgi:hypothetical protein